MGFIFTLLGIDVPPGSALEDIELQFRSPLPWFVVALFVLLLAGGVGVAYWFERARVPLGIRLALALVRTCALTLLVLLICRPVLQATLVGPRAREILLLIDNTQSMKQQDRRFSPEDQRRVSLVSASLGKNPSRVDLVRAVLENPQFDLLAGLQKHGPLMPVLFGANAHSALADSSLVAKRAVTAKDVLAHFNAGEGETALADVIKAQLQRKEGDLPGAIVVITDGRDNYSKYTLDEAAAECARLGVPLHIYGVGSTAGGSLKMGDLAFKDPLFAGAKVKIPVRWFAEGITQGTAVVTVTLAGMTQTQQVPLVPGKEQVHEFTFNLPKARQKGEVQGSEVTASVHLLEDAAFKDTRKRPVRIIDGKVRVLVIENTPRKDYQFLQTVLLDDPQIEPRFWLLTADPEAQKGGPFEKGFPSDKAQLNKFDLVILGDVPPDKLGKKQREMLAEYVQKDRGSLLILAGRQNMPGAYVGDEFKDFAQLLPVEYGRYHMGADGPGSPLAYKPDRTSAARRAEWLMLADRPEDNEKLWKEMPGFFWHFPVTDLRGGAEVLLEHPTAKLDGASDNQVAARDKQPMPLLVWHQYGKGRVMFVGFEETWRWRYNTDRKLFGDFWSQIILHMAQVHMGTSQVELEVNRSAMTLGKPGAVFARLLKPNFEPFTEPQVKGELTYLDDKSPQKRTEPLVLELVPGREKEGAYRAVLPNDQPGLWQVKLTYPQEATLVFDVPVPQKHELKEAPMDAEALRSAARTSGGRFYREEDLHELAAAIQPRETTFRLRQEVLLWGWIPFVLFVLLVTCEWVGRKFANLS